MSSLNRLDIIVFGVSGFTGKRTAVQLSRLLKIENYALKWGVAGRSKVKLEQVLLQIQKETGKDHSDVASILADVNDAKSLESMTSQAKIIINVVGPYDIYGERVIRACIKTKTHHIDISGEIQYIETMQLKYHQQAKEKGIFLISACGVESIPADLGVIFLQKNFKGTLNSVESYLTLKEVGESKPGPIINYGSFASGVYLYLKNHELRDIRSKLYPEPLPKFKPRLEFRGLFFKDNLLKKWTTMFPSPDISIVQRTQRYLYETKKQRLVQYQGYLSYDSFFQVLAMGMLSVVFIFMCLFRFTQRILLSYPTVFTLGLVSHDGPSETKQENTLFDMVLVGQGWSEKLPEITDQYDKPPNKEITARISCTNPVYRSTGITCALAAITVLQERAAMPKDGGCYPPGAAFADTSMIEKLNKYGIKFELNPLL